MLVLGVGSSITKERSIIMRGMNGSTAYFFNGEQDKCRHDHVQVIGDVTLVTDQLGKTVEIRNGNRMATARLVRPVIHVVEVDIESGQVPVAWYYLRYPGKPGRPVRCNSMTDALYLQMDVYGTGRIGPIFQKGGSK
jgi:hypothetical protein